MEVIAIQNQVDKLLSDVIDHWSDWETYEQFYLKTLLPNLLDDPESGNPTERKLFGRLREEVPRNEWDTLSERITELRAGERTRREQQQQQKVHDQERRKVAKFLEKEHEHKQQQVVIELESLLKNDYVRAVAEYPEKYSHLVDIAEFERIRDEYVEAWVTSQNLVGFAVDPQQARAIGELSANTLVTARAGSGKTSTLVEPDTVSSRTLRDRSKQHIGSRIQSKSRSGNQT